MTPTASTLSEIKLDGSREQEPETVGKILRSVWDFARKELPLRGSSPDGKG